MGNKPFFQANIHSPGTGVALIVIAITLIPLGMACLAQLSCFGRPSSHSAAWSIERMRVCNGG
ncbi:hypothetical protein SynBIOSU31_02018 [Synechococcus sp. BIOS-U3-1]|nr:hypothetical protein SynBIOSU31_02018 [Synechococcus sp. BIOS-U3-1]